MEEKERKVSVERKSSVSAKDGESTLAPGGRNVNGAVTGVRSTGGGLAGIARMLGSKAKGQDGPQNGTGGGSKRQKGCEDDLPLGSEAHSLGTGHQNFHSGHHEAVDKQSKMIGWQSFSSDVSNQTSASSASLEILLNERQVDPEEVLLNLGFGLEREGFVPSLARIPERFLHHPTRASGIRIPGLGDDMESDVLEEDEETETNAAPSAGVVSPATSAPPARKRPGGFYFCGLSFWPCDGYVDLMCLLRKDVPLYFFNEEGSKCYSVCRGKAHDLRTTVGNNVKGIIKKPVDLHVDITIGQPVAVTLSQPQSQPVTVTRSQPQAVTIGQPVAVTRSQPQAVAIGQPVAVTIGQTVAFAIVQPETGAIRDVNKKETRGRVKKEMVGGDGSNEQTTLKAKEVQHCSKYPGEVTNIDLQEDIPGRQPVLVDAQPSPELDETVADAQPAPGLHQTVMDAQPPPGMHQTVTDAQPMPRVTVTSKENQVVGTESQPVSSKVSKLPHKGEKKLSKYLDMSYVRMAARRLGESITGKIHKKPEASLKPNWHRQVSESPKVERRSKSSSPGLTRADNPGAHLTSYYSRITSRLRVAPLISRESFASVKSGPVASGVVRSSSSHDGFYKAGSKHDESLMSRSLESQEGDSPASPLPSVDVVTASGMPQRDRWHLTESGGNIGGLETASQPSSKIDGDIAGMATFCHDAGIYGHVLDQPAGSSHPGSMKMSHGEGSCGANTEIAHLQFCSDKKDVWHPHGVGPSGDHGAFWEETNRNAHAQDSQPLVDSMNKKLSFRYRMDSRKQGSTRSESRDQCKPPLVKVEMSDIDNDKRNNNTETADLEWCYDGESLDLNQVLYFPDYNRPPPRHGADASDPHLALLSSQSYVTGSYHSVPGINTNQYVPPFKSNQATLLSSQRPAPFCDLLKPNSHPHIDDVSGGPTAQSLPPLLSGTNLTQPHGAGAHSDNLPHPSAHPHPSLINPCIKPATRTNTDTSWTHVDHHQIHHPPCDNENPPEDLPTISDTNMGAGGPGSAGSHSKHLKLSSQVSSEHLQPPHRAGTHEDNGNVSKDRSIVAEPMRTRVDLSNQGAGQLFTSSIKHSQSMRMPEQNHRPVVLKRRTSLGSMRRLPPPTTSLSWLHTSLAAELLDQISEKDKEEIDLSNISTSSSDSEEEESKFSRSFSGEETLV